MSLIALLLSLVLERFFALLPDRGAGGVPDRVADDPLPDADLDLLDDELAPSPVRGPETDGDLPGALPRAHPLHPVAMRVIEWVTARRLDEGRPELGWIGWSGIVLAPALVAGILQSLFAQAGLGGWLLVLALHVAVLYGCVLVGRFHRRFARLELLASAGDRAQCEALVRAWYDDSARLDRAGGAGPDSTLAESTPSATPIDRLALQLPVMDAYRDIFAPLFWYLLLPGASGPLAYLFARFAAQRCGGLAVAGLALLDWLPSRAAAIVFALAGRFDDAMLGLRAAHAMGRRLGPGAPVQQALLLASAGGSLGTDLLDPASRQRLAEQAPEFDVVAEAPTLAQVGALRALLVRVGFICGGFYLLFALVP